MCLGDNLAGLRVVRAARETVPAERMAARFDTVLGLTASVLTGSRRQRTAYLKINYRNIVPIEKQLQFDAGVDSEDGRKIFVSGRLRDGDTLLTEADALFVRLKPGQP